MELNIYLYKMVYVSCKSQCSCKSFQRRAAMCPICVVGMSSMLKVEVRLIFEVLIVVNRLDKTGIGIYMLERKNVKTIVLTRIMVIWCR